LTNAAKHHQALIGIRGGNLEDATAALSSLLAQGVLLKVVKFTLGMALLRVPLLPNQMDLCKAAKFSSSLGEEA
jgi:hypothetical protein